MLTCAFRCRAWVLGLTLVSSTFAGAATVDAQTREEVPRYFFRVEIDGIGSGSFRSVSGLGIETEVIEFREGGDTGFIRKLPGATKWPDIVLTRGFTGDAKLYRLGNRVPSHRGRSRSEPASSSCSRPAAARWRGGLS